jgi:lipid II:glycine glycyltransferase (peptidoglycan interpeptide bridge formation enzyme)
MQLLMWKAIQDAKNSGLLELDMGRTDWNNQGLLTYKDRWGGARSTLMYFRHPASQPQDCTESIPMRIAKRIVTVAPDSLLTTAGRILYRHIG